MATFFDRLCEKFVVKFLRNIKRGYIGFTFPDGRTEHFGDPQSQRKATFHIHNPKLFWRLIKDGGIGLGEGYVAGDWTCDELGVVLRILLDNWHAIDESKVNILKVFRLFHFLSHLKRGNSVNGSKDNISAHYDLSNEMFRKFLDPSMTYSCALFRSIDESLEKAQKNKRDAIVGKAQVNSDDHMLEIGSGWGTLAIEAAKERGCKVTSITVSEEQLQYARAQAEAAKVTDLVDFQFRDYRSVEGKFDKIVSVEMLEAVGHEYLPDFFSQCERLLKPEGIVVLQVITFPEQYYDDYRKRCDWIQKYIFPGSHLPSLKAMVDAAAENSELVVESIENLAPHYARTLCEWRKRFIQAKPELDRLGYDAYFQKTFEYYLASCEAEFASRWLGVFQIVMTRPNNNALMGTSIWDEKATPFVPPLRAVVGAEARRQ